MSRPADPGFRRSVLVEIGATDAETQNELLQYNEAPYSSSSRRAEIFPLPDEPHLDRWRLYLQEANELGALDALKRRFAQLRFPVREGMSEDAAYRASTRKGKPGSEGAGIEIDDELELFVHPTMAGHIPVLVARSRKDFESLVQAFTERNEPVSVPASMGACLVSGLNNWDRISEYRREWEQERGGATEGEWLAEFRNLVPRKELYQDRFIILSSGPYSGIAAPPGLGDEQWREESVSIRREHELTHYFTQRVYGAVRNNLLDEIVSDFVGLVRSRGRYPPELAARFLGLEDFPRYRDGGRLQNYLGEPPVSDAAFEALQRLTHRTIQNLARLAEAEPHRLESLEALARLTQSLLESGLEALASDEMLERVGSGS